MLDLRTANGTKVVMHYQNDQVRDLVESTSSLFILGFLDKANVTHRKIENWDTGKGTVHILMGESGSVVDILTEGEYADWQKNPVWKWAQPTLDLSNLVTAKGIKVIVHLEVPYLQKELDEAYSQDHFMKNLDNVISNPKFGFVDVSPGATIHMLVNIYGDAIYLPDEKFVEWNKNPDWFHEESRKTSTPYILVGVSHQGENNKFTGPPYNQVEEYLKDPIIGQIYEKARREGNCLICLAPEHYCPLRHDSFDPDAFAAAVKAAKASI